MNFADFMAGVSVPVASSSSSSTESTIKGVCFAGKVVSYADKNGKKTDHYQVSVDDHMVAMYENGVPTGNQMRVIDLWVYPEDEFAHIRNPKGEEAKFKPTDDIKKHLDNELKKLGYISFELPKLSVEALKECKLTENFSLQDLLVGLSHSGCKISEVKDADKKIVARKTSMVKIRVVELADGKYGLKVLKSFFKKR